MTAKKIVMAFSLEEEDIKIIEVHNQAMANPGLSAALRNILRDWAKTTIELSSQETEHLQSDTHWIPMNWKKMSGGAKLPCEFLIDNKGRATHWRPLSSLSPSIEPIICDEINRLPASEQQVSRLVKIPIVGKVSGPNSHVTLVQGNGECIDVTPEELAARE